MHEISLCCSSFSLCYNPAWPPETMISCEILLLKPNVNLRMNLSYWCCYSLCSISLSWFHYSVLYFLISSFDHIHRNHVLHTTQAQATATIPANGITTANTVFLVIHLRWQMKFNNINHHCATFLKLMSFGFASLCLCCDYRQGQWKSFSITNYQVCDSSAFKYKIKKKLFYTYSLLISKQYIVFWTP